MFRPRICALVVLLLAATASTVFAAGRTLVRLDLSTPANTAFVEQNRGQLDVISAKRGVHAHVAADARTMAFLAASGHPYEVVQENLEASLAYPDKSAGFGVYHTWSEGVAWMDTLRQLYPQVVSARWSIGQSLEGRDIWAIRVSDNPDLDENEPEILIDGMHHSREIMASEFPIMFAEYLAQNYGTDPEVTYLLDNRELYIVPVVNPDGLVYNETTNPNGGGLWRKNRRDNGDGSHGVDLNRNYPFEWGYDDAGSSPDPYSEVYRGPGPASEVEIQALMNFINSREIRTHDTVHTYSNLLLHPWGFVNTATPDDLVYTHMAAEMTRYNGYTPGRPGDILYDVNGGAFDWAYGDESKHVKFYSFSSEIGSGADGFWPAQNRRQPLFQENIWPHLYLMRAAGTWVAAHSPVVLNAAKSVAPGQSAELSLTLENQSVYDSIVGLDVSIATDDPWVQFGASTRTVGALASMATTDLAADPLPFTVDPGCPDGHVVELTATVHLADGDLAFPLTIMVGTPVMLVQDDFEAGTGNWTLDSLWGPTTAQANSPSTSLTDSPAGNYPDQQSRAATLTTPVQALSLQFHHRYSIETGYDYGRVQINDGSSWTTLDSYTGSQASWQQVSFDLSEFAGQDLQVRFVMETDYSVVDDGWYIDDVVITGAPVIVKPATPVAVAPGAGAVTGNAQLVVANSTDPLGAPLVYGFRVYADAACTQLVASIDDVAEGAGQTAWTLPGLADGNYWWRAWAGTTGRRSYLSEAASLEVFNSSSVGDGIRLPLGLRVLDGVTGGTARLRLQLPTQRDVDIAIYDARGARVRHLHGGPLGGGEQVLTWDGRDSGGRAVASGLYFVRMEAGREAFTGRVVIVR